MRPAITFLNIQLSNSRAAIIPSVEWYRFCSLLNYFLTQQNSKCFTAIIFIGNKIKLISIIPANRL